MAGSDHFHNDSSADWRHESQAVRHRASRRLPLHLKALNVEELRLGAELGRRRASEMLSMLTEWMPLLSEPERLGFENMIQEDLEPILLGYCQAIGDRVLTRRRGTPPA